jgi:spore maturation protein CgeB
MNIAFFNQNFLIQQEVVAALRRLPGTKVIIVDIPLHPVTEQIRQATQVLETYGCSALITINEGGIDTGGILWEFIELKGIVHVNWSVDDPFYEEIILTKKFRPSNRRFDFVSDKGYVEPMRERGYHAYFLPLAVDTSIFSPADPSAKEHDIVFVGNSYLYHMNDMLKTCPGFIDTLAPFLGKVVRYYNDNVAYDVEDAIAKALHSVKLPRDLTFEKAHYIAKHTAGYLARKQMILFLVKKYPGFKVFGESGWLNDLPAERLFTAKYYDGLCDVYRKAKIAIDINRMVIRNGFTQRVFDVPASGGFLITSSKPVVNEYFETSGPNQELAAFKSLKDITDLIDYFLIHDDKRLAIAERGMQKVVSNHTYNHRIAEMFRVISQGFERMRQTPGI